MTGRPTVGKICLLMDMRERGICEVTPREETMTVRMRGPLHTYTPCFLAAASGSHQKPLEDNP